MMTPGTVKDRESGAFLHLAALRRSVRSYADRPVERTKIERCIEAARLAPSACNSQPWMFIVVDEPGLKDKVAAAAGGGVLPLNHFMQQAPVLVAVVAEPVKTTLRAGAFFKDKPFCMMDVAIAAEHFCLQAADEGLGTCILGWFDEPRVRRLLNIPWPSRPALLITLGYAGSPASSPARRKEIGEMSAWNTYPRAPVGERKHLTGWRAAAGLALWLGITYAAAAIAGAATARADIFYSGLTRPDWAPPGWLFGPVWTLLYTLMAIASWLVWRARGFRGAPGALGFYVAQLAVNAAWSWLFFEWRLGAASFAWILLLCAMVLGLIRTFGRINKAAGLLLWPYLAWLCFAAALALAVWRLNPGFL